ncbi:DASH family cryptochrome [Aquimarina agarivorans]|uniref:DASH family cryptochrome n=1 Tax=Aquimarina agarivorans TaxID=980584 RepID=UPI000248FB02|nr:DASH family cryptochrome [Aquimarina agarivorans]
MSTGLIWFRNDLRVNDQKSLAEATRKHDSVIGVYCFDPRQFSTDPYGFIKTGKFRTQFLIETVEQLKLNLAKFNIPLFVYFNKPEDKLPEIISAHNCTHIYCQKEWTSEELKVTNAVKKALTKNLVAWIESYDQFLYQPDNIQFTIEKIPQVFTRFRKSVEKYAKVEDLATIDPAYLQNPIENKTKILNLTDLGFTYFETPSHTAFPFKGGENSALERLNSYFWETKKLAYYKKTRNGLLGTDYSSKFSAWLANGSISAKTIYIQVKKFEKEIKKNDSTYWLIFELLWRDYFKYISLKHGNSIFKIGGILNKNYNWSTDMEVVQHWIHGNTGKPFVDANMLELQQTGWMSNRGRQNVGSYLAKDLLVDWRIGAAYFESMLIDYDVHSNYGNWMYVAGIGNDPRDRKFNVDLQAERYDTNKKFQRLWLQPTLF